MDADFETRTYLGIVTVTRYDLPSGVRVQEVTTVGAWGGRTTGFGFRDEKNISVPPDCRIVILAESSEQLESVEEMLESALAQNQGQICTIDQ